MDDMKKATAKNYTAFDLNAKCVRVRNRQKLEHFFKRTARRKGKQQLKSKYGAAIL